MLIERQLPPRTNSGSHGYARFCAG